MSRPFRADHSDRYLGRVKMGSTRRTLHGGVLHWATGTAPLSAPPLERLENVLAENAPRGTGYSRIVCDGVNYRIAPWERMTAHAGGRNASVDMPNTRLYGVSIIYIGPSQRPRGIAGEVQGPHHRLGTAWYPPIARYDVLLAAHAMRELRVHGLGEVWGHAEINTDGGKPGAPPMKSDPYPVDMDEFRALVLDDNHWRAVIRAGDWREPRETR